MKKIIWSCLVIFVALAGGNISRGQSPDHRIEIHAKRFSFQPAEITLKEGETVTLALTSDDVPHSLLVEGLHINAAMTKGHTSEVTVTPDKVGEFPGRCGKFCGSGHGSMTFVVHVVGK